MYVCMYVYRDDLTVFKEKYVTVCGERDEADAEREATKREMEVSKDMLEKVCTTWTSMSKDMYMCGHAHVWTYRCNDMHMYELTSLEFPG